METTKVVIGDVSVWVDEKAETVMFESGTNKFEISFEGWPIVDRLVEIAFHKANSQHSKSQISHMLDNITQTIKKDDKPDWEQ